MTCHIALLRGINLGPHRRVPMAGLREALEDAGYAGVRTLGQSGNVVVDAGGPPELLTPALEDVLRERFGLDVPVVVRTADDLADLVRRNPLADVAEDPRRHQVFFLSAKLPAAAAAALEAADVAPERFVVSGREVFCWHPEGIQRSPLVRMLMDDRLGVVATGRNWSTVTKLLQVAEDRRRPS